MNFIILSIIFILLLEQSGHLKTFSNVFCEDATDCSTNTLNDY